MTPDEKDHAHQHHRQWIDNAHNWEDMDYEDQVRWLTLKLSYHDPKGWLLEGAKRESAQNIGALILALPARRLARRLARLLIGGIHHE